MDLKITIPGKHIQSSEINSSTDTDNQRLQKAAKGFESIFTAMMLKSMTNSTGGLFGESNFGGDIFSGMFENEIASKMSEGRGLGLAEFLTRKLNKEKLPLQGKVIGKINNANAPEVKQVFPLETPLLKPGTASLERLNKYDMIIEEASKHFGVDKNLIKSVILTESAANDKAISKAKAKGLMQLIDSTAKDMGVENVWDPKQNIWGGTKYLSQMIRQCKGDLKLALACYNAGPGNVQKYNGIPPFEETEKYISRVLGYYNHLNG